MVKVDYIIAGGGAAGLSLALRIADSEKLKDKTVIIIDKDIKKDNDRTWCYWEKGVGYFDDIVHHHWEHLRADGDGNKHVTNIAPYSYKMLRGQDFYVYAKRKLNQNKNITFLNANIEKWESLRDFTIVHTSEGIYQSSWCFSSISKQKINTDKNHYLDQHFKGWFIKTEKPVFNALEAHFMDFRTPQNQETRFLYVLPYSPTEALIEIAIFSRNHLPDLQYDEILENYLSQHWDLIKDTYSIIQEEKGVIPMTDAVFTKKENHTIYIGTVGGDTRSSTGFTFLNIQRRVEKIVQGLNKGKNIGSELTIDRFYFYDKVLLRVLEEERYTGEKLFMRLFRKNPMQRVLAFLQGDTHIFQEIRLMLTAPILPFMISAIRIGLGIRIKRNK